MDGNLTLLCDFFPNSITSQQSTSKIPIEFSSFLQIFKIDESQAKIDYSPFWNAFLVLKYLIFRTNNQNNRISSVEIAIESHTKDDDKNDNENVENALFLLKDDTKIEIYQVLVSGNSKIWIRLIQKNGNAIWLLPFEKTETLNFPELI